MVSTLSDRGKILICPTCKNQFMGKHYRHIHCSKKCHYINTERNRKLSLAKIESKNPNWKNNNVKYAGIHYWIKSRLPQPKGCVACGKITTQLDLCNISGEYKRDISDYKYQCRHCHMKEDGRLNAFKEISLKNAILKKRNNLTDIIVLYDSGLSINEIANLHHTTVSNMWTALKRRKCKFRAKCIHHSEIRDGRKKQV